MGTRKMHLQTIIFIRPPLCRTQIQKQIYSFGMRRLYYWPVSFSTLGFNLPYQLKGEHFLYDDIHKYFCSGKLKKDVGRTRPTCAVVVPFSCCV